MQRRDFLRRAVAGGAMVSAPAFLQGCGVTQPMVVAESLPEDPFLDWFAIDRQVLGNVLSKLGASGADGGELFFQHRRQSVLRMQAGALGSARTDITQGVGIRIIRGVTSGFSHTDDLTESGMLIAAGHATGAADASVQIPAPVITSRPPGRLYTTTVPWSDVGVDRKLPLLEQVDSLARAADPSVTDVQISWSDTDERVLVARLDGQMVFDHRPMSRLSVQVTMTRDGERHSGFANMAARAGLAWFTDERIAATVGQAVDRTSVLFDARRPPVGNMPVVLAAGTSGVLLHEAIGHALEADFVANGKSPYASAINERIADSSVTIIDQGTIPNERGALNVDDEGNDCRRNVLVEDGVLRGYLQDQLSAGRSGAEPTGSGRRESYRHEPLPRMTCTFMENGTHEQDELIESLGRGIVVETYVGGNVDLGNGDFNFTIRNGWLVEKGRILMPVRDFRLVGNGPDALRKITMVGNDSTLDRGGWTCGKNGQTVPVSQGMPSVLVAELGVEALS